MLPGSNDRETMLKNGAILKLKNNIREQKLEIARARSALRLTTSDLHQYEDLHLYLDEARKAFASYEQGIARLGELSERLHELEG